MADLRGGSTVGGRPILGKEARDNYIGKIVGNRLSESLLYDDGSKVIVNGILDATALQEGGTNLSSKYLGINSNAVSATRLATARTISLTGGVTGSVTFDGSVNVSIATTIGSGTHTHSISEITSLQGELDTRMRTNTATSTSGTLGASNMWTTSGDDYTKFRMWGNSGTYAIGMVSGITYGYLADYAMTFTMNNDIDRGFWWGYDGQAKSDGAMSLTTDGRLYVKNIVNAGTLYSRGTVYENSNPLSTIYAPKSSYDSHVGDSNIHKSWGLFDTNGGQDFRGRGKRVVVAGTTNLVINYGGDFTGGVDMHGNYLNFGNGTQLEFPSNGYLYLKNNPNDYIRVRGGYFDFVSGSSILTIASTSISTGAGNLVFKADTGAGYVVIQSASSYIYLQTANQVRVVQPNTTATYMPILASTFSVNSVETAKENIKTVEKNALDIVTKKTKIYEYDLKVDRGNKNRKRKYGVVIGREVPEEILDYDNEGVDLYAMNSILWKAVQELTLKVEQLENEKIKSN